MRKIKKEVLDRLTNWKSLGERLQFSGWVLQDFEAYYPHIGAHERTEAIETLFINSMSFYSREDYELIHNEKGEQVLHIKKIGSVGHHVHLSEEDQLEIKNKIEKIICYLEFHNYFYGVSLLPSGLIFFEDETKKRLCSTPVTCNAWTYNNFKEVLRRESPDIVVLHGLQEHDGDWIIRMNMKKGLKCIFDNPNYIER